MNAQGRMTATCILATLFVFCAASLLTAQSAKLFLPETNSTIALSFISDTQVPEHYGSIAIRSSGKTTRLVAHDQIIRIPATRAQRKAAFVWSADTPGLKINPSRFFLVGQYTFDAKPHTLLFFLGDAAASDATPLLIVGFSDDGKPSKVFEQQYELTSFQPTEVGASMTGRETVPQALCGTNGAPISSTTYDPYSVFALHPGSKPTYLLAESRDYNRKHYVWAGPKVREDYAVIFNLPGHPRIYGTSAARHDKLMAGIKCDE